MKVQLISPIPYHSSKYIIIEILLITVDSFDCIYEISLLLFQVSRLYVSFQNTLHSISNNDSRMSTRNSYNINLSNKQTPLLHVITKQTILTCFETLSNVLL